MITFIKGVALTDILDSICGSTIRAAGHCTGKERFYHEEKN